MVYVNVAVCDGCGECVDICPNGALVFQNNHAVILQDLCQDCEICIDACPQSAILSVREVQDSGEVMREPELSRVVSVSHIEPPERVPVRELIIPIIGSAVLWFGRELLPRLADMALGYMDRRIQLDTFAHHQKISARSDRQVSASMRKGRHVRRRQRIRKSIQTKY